MEYHDLFNCYVHLGWQQRSRTEEIQPIADLEQPFSRIKIERPPSSGYLLFALFGENGRWLSGDHESFAPGVVGTLEQVFRRHSGDVGYQIQVLVQSPTELSSGQHMNVDRLFRRASAELSSQVTAQQKRDR